MSPLLYECSYENKMLTVLTVNIGAAALQRAKTLLVWLSKRSEDIFILTETSSGSGTKYLLEKFRQAGFHVIHNPDSDRGVALVSRVRVVEDLCDQLTGISIPGRIACAALDTTPRIAVLGVYVPSRDRTIAKTEKKETFIATLLQALGKLPPSLREHMIIGGDYNVIGRDHQPLRRGFLLFEFDLLEALEALSFLDAHELCHPGTQVYSWIGRTGDGYRYDYFHVASSLQASLRGCTYLHETREQCLTDHAAVRLQIKVDRMTWLYTMNPSVSSILSLF